MRQLPRATRLEAIQPFHVMAILARARELEASGRDIVHMEIGEPDFPTPQPVIEAGQKALAKGDIHYTPALGLPALREALAGFYATRYGVSVDPGRIVVTPGASGALLLALGVVLDHDAQLMLADPGYPCNRNFARFLEARAQSVPVGASTNFQLDADLIQRYWQPKTSAVLLASPSNPTGTVVEGAAMQAIAEVVAAKHGALIVDEIYHGLVYGDALPTALQYGDDNFAINSFSKYFTMTGWRLGWLVAPKSCIADIDKLAQNLFLAAPTLAQHAALAAFTPETLTILEQRREAFRQRRDFLLPALREIGFTIPVTPSGAFYIYAGCEKFTDDSFKFAVDLLEQAGVAITPGIDFGSHHAKRYVRFAYTTSMERLEQGVERIRGFVQG